jgi:FKBP-type peptidyl-prolyl cis-trans isomerase (trigger factor)
MGSLVTKSKLRLFAVCLSLPVSLLRGLRAKDCLFAAADSVSRAATSSPATRPIDRWTTEGGFDELVQSQRQIDLPLLDHLRVKRIKITVTERNIDEAMENLRRQEGGALDAKALKGLGFGSTEQLRRALRETMEAQIKYDVEQSLRDQVKNYLRQEVQLKPSLQLSARQSELGMKLHRIDAVMHGRDGGRSDRAGDEAAREIETFLILRRAAEVRRVEAPQSELDRRIEALAVRRGREPGEMKQQMAADGMLAALYVQVHGQIVLDRILDSAQIEDVEQAPE